MRSAVLAVLALFLGGCCCTTVDRVGVKTLDPSHYTEVNRRASGKTPTVVLADGRRFAARDLRLEDGEATWRDAASGQPGGTEARLVREVRFVTAWRGARNGGVYGGLTGLALGVLIGLGHKHGDSGTWGGKGRGDGDPLRTEETIAAGVLFGWGGYLLGASVGAAAGGEDVYLAPLPGPP
jgi:hypothetical protein